MSSLEVCHFLNLILKNMPLGMPSKIGFSANGAFSHDVTAAILMFQNNETAAMLVYQENPLGV